MLQGFEDCRLLDAVLLKHAFELGPALDEFSTTRRPDAEAICNLAMYNYVEVNYIKSPNWSITIMTLMCLQMRDLVNRKSFLVRKQLDNLLYKAMPNYWIPLYTSVTFSHMPYSQCINNKEWQDNVSDIICLSQQAITDLKI